MNFKFNTEYNLTALTAMAKTLRKTVRKRKNTASRIFGCVVIVLALILIIPFGDERFVLNFNRIITLAAAIVILAVLLFEDKINAYFAKKRMLRKVFLKRMNSFRKQNWQQADGSMRA